MAVVGILTGELLGGLIPEGNAVDVVDDIAEGNVEVGQVRVFGESVRNWLAVGVSVDGYTIDKTGT